MTAPVIEFRWSGTLAGLSPCDRHAMLDRSTSSDPGVCSTVAGILARVRAEGDAALRELGMRYDGVVPDPMEVPPEAWSDALARTGPPLRAALERAAANLRTVHAAWLPREERVAVEPGIVVARRPDPLGRVGLYAPGGRASYPSSVLMGSIPARVAGVGEIILCSPPGPGGRPAEAVLAAAALSGVDRVFAVGGAGAIGAMAFGTKSVPRVDRIIGPGNAWVTEAKLQVSGSVSLDSPAGPSECLILADGAADPEFIARELLAQAEHDPRACAVVLTWGPAAERQAASIAAALAALVEVTPRRAVVESALASRGALLIARDSLEALDFSSAYAPEHLVLAVDHAEQMLAQVRNAGTVFVGGSSSNVFGDYMTGANHILPTGGLARSYSGVSTSDFVRWTTWQSVSPQAAEGLAWDVVAFAEAEGLSGHAAAAAAWVGAA